MHIIANRWYIRQGSQNTHFEQFCNNVYNMQHQEQQKMHLENYQDTWLRHGLITTYCMQTRCVSKKYILPLSKKRWTRLMKSIADSNCNDRTLVKVTGAELSALIADFSFMSSLSCHFSFECKEIESRRRKGRKKKADYFFLKYTSAGV